MMNVKLLVAGVLLLISLELRLRGYWLVIIIHKLVYALKTLEDLELGGRYPSKYFQLSSVKGTQA